MKELQRTVHLIQTTTQTELKKLIKLRKQKKISRTKFHKKRSKLKKQQKEATKSCIQYFPKKTWSNMPGKTTKQQWCALAYCLSPKYLMINETKFFGQPAPDSIEDVSPETIFTKKDFDEAMLVHVIQTFDDETLCKEFIDNKAKHDFEFCQVVCYDLYKMDPLDFLLTQHARVTVERGYITELLQKTVVDREERAKYAKADAKNHPELVQQQVEKDGQVYFEASQNTKKIQQAMTEEKQRHEDESKKEEVKEVKEDELTATATSATATSATATLVTATSATATAPSNEETISK